ncbi:hypothetical protein P167DRAFT_7289 [Morchella conica CCBAS932]|uniref:Uncharacterized protein n=1 Tax=Morchella conica CCBAS932 TaxID=1392247 RepID=A0A3N4L539_9PEZI|nr:hypothetical protein P167DRAFT_7289 [Morchella conica CCBAS932]
MQSTLLVHVDRFVLFCSCTTFIYVDCRLFVLFQPGGVFVSLYGTYCPPAVCGFLWGRVNINACSDHLWLRYYAITLCMYHPPSLSSWRGSFFFWFLVFWGGWIDGWTDPRRGGREEARDVLGDPRILMARFGSVRCNVRVFF